MATPALIPEEARRAEENTFVGIHRLSLPLRDVCC